MGLLGTTTAESYYNQSQNFTGNGTINQFDLTVANFNPLPSAETDFEIYINEVLIKPSNYSYSSPRITFTSTNANASVQSGSNGAPNNGLSVIVRQVAETEQYGNYQFVSIENLINNFFVSYVGEGKIIDRAKKADIAFHAQRAIQEFSYDTFKSSKSQEIEIPPSLTMLLPQDYVNYVKLTWKDNSGMERVLYPIRNTSNPLALLQDSEYNYLFDSNGNIQSSYNSETWNKFKAPSADAAEYTQESSNDIEDLNAQGARYGIAPEFAQSNGSFFIDPLKGTVFFSSNVSGKIVTLKYISDGLGTDAEMIVHKFAEEAMYKYLAHAILSTKIGIPEYIVNRFKKERFAAVRTAKLRLSNLKSEELTQLMRNKSKQIKH